MNLYKREIYKKSLQHAERRNHKYLYKIGDRYIYPEDVATGKASHKPSGIADKAKKMLSDFKPRTETHINGRSINDKTDGYKEVNRRKNAKTMDARDLIANTKSKEELEEEYRRKDPVGYNEYKMNRINRDVESAKAEYEKTMADIEARNKKLKGSSSSESTVDRMKVRADRKRKTEAQRKSAHAGVEAYEKKFPNGGSTEELERQKEKKFLKDRAIAREARRSMRTTGTTAEIEGAKRAAQKRTRDDFKDGPGVAGTDEMARQMEKTKIRKTEKANLERRRKQKKAKSETPTRTISGATVDSVDTLKDASDKSRKKKKKVAKK